MKTLTFFNNKGGVGKTSLTYHISWMLKEMGNSVLSVDLDPQANLTGMFVSESKMEQIIEKEQSLYYSLAPLMRGTGDIKQPIPLLEYDKTLGLLPGDLKLSSVEAEFSGTWAKCLDGDERAFRVTTAFSRILTAAAKEMEAQWVVMDMGPNLGAINRAVLIASDYVVFPLGPDLFSYQGLKNVGEFLNKWRKEWQERKNKKPQGMDFDLPEGNMKPLGYIMMRHSIRHDRPVKAYERWIRKMPEAYKESVLQSKTTSERDYMLAHIKDYRSLMPIAQENHKPMFLLKPGDGAIGSHFQAAQACYGDFQNLTKKIISAIQETLS